MKFTIEKVSKITGINAATLRNWEKRHGFPQPVRGESGHRYYCAGDLEFLKKVNNWVATGHCLPDIGQYYREHRSQFAKGSTQPTDLVDDVQYRVDLLYDSLIAFDQRTALTHYAILNAKLSPEMLFDRVFQAILCRLGEGWSQGQISIAQEHFASSFIRLRLASFLAMDFPTTQNKKFISATLMKERHEGGLMLISCHLKYRGYPVHYFGPDLPTSALKELVDGVKPDCVLLSYVDPERVVEDWPAILSLKARVCLGGIAFSSRVQNLKLTNCLEKKPENIFISQHYAGRDAASFIEMIVQSRQ